MTEYVTDGLLLVDKPRGMSSHDVVMRARRALWTKRIGHTGTLDPMATGLLVLAVGEGTKLVAHLTAHDKEYECTLQLGSETDSFDADGVVTRTAPLVAFDAAKLDAVCRVLEAQTLQVPPLVSAVRIDGERLYERARRGEAFDAPPREVVLHRLDVLSFSTDSVQLRVACGKGFYVRSLARDLAIELGSVGHLTQLRRTRVGVDHVKDALAAHVLEQASRGDEAARALMRAKIIPLRDAVTRLATATLDAVGLDHARHGRLVPLTCLQGVPSGTSVLALVDAERTPVAIGNVVDDGVKIARGFVQRAAKASSDTSAALATEQDGDHDDSDQRDGNSST